MIPQSAKKNLSKLFRNYSSTRHSDKFTADDCIMDVKKPVLNS